MNHNRSFLALVVLVLVSLACGLFSGGDSSSEVDTLPGSEEGSNEASPPESVPDNSGNLDTEFPLPPDVENLMDLGTTAYSLY